MTKLRNKIFIEVINTLFLHEIFSKCSNLYLEIYLYISRRYLNYN